MVLPLNLLKSLSGASKKKSIGVRFPKLFSGGKRRTRRRHKSRKHN